MKIENLARGRLYLVSKMPYLSMAVWSLFPVPIKGLGTFAVDKNWRLYYDPDLDWDIAHIAGTMYHEIWHLLREHQYRMQPEHDQFIWNVACDCEINDDIESEGIFSLPDGYVSPSFFSIDNNLLAEQYYEILIKKKAVNAVDMVIPHVGAGNCGSSVDGVHRPWEVSPADAPSIGRVEGRVIARNVAEEIIRAKSIGNVPYGLERWAEEVLHGKVDWRRELRAMISNTFSEIAGMVDYSYRKPSRRHNVIKDVVMPSMKQPVIRVAIIVDTSGSMGEKELGAALAEVNGIVKAVSAHNDVVVLSVDAAVHNVQKVFSVNQIKLFGGGGTDMGVGIEYAGKLRPPPNVVIVITDGYTPWPEHRTVKQPVIAAILDFQNSKTYAYSFQPYKIPPSWIKHISVPVEG